MISYPIIQVNKELFLSFLTSYDYHFVIKCLIFFCFNRKLLIYSFFFSKNQLIINPEPGDHYKFEKLDQVIDKLNLAISSDELNAENCMTIETLYFPVDCDFVINTKLEHTLFTFPSSYVSILRVFYIEYKKIENESLTCKLRKLNYSFKINIKDFIPKTLKKGTFFKRPEFEKLTNCIERASKWIEDESRLHQLKYQKLMKELETGNSKDFLFDFKNAQCIEIKTKILKHNIDSKVMAHTTDNGDYIRIFRIAYMELVKLKDSNQKKSDLSLSSKASSKWNSIKKTNLINRSKLLIKSRQSNRLLDNESSSFEDNLLNLSTDTDENQPSKIHLSSIIFTPTDGVTTISEMKRKIQNYTMTKCRHSQNEKDEISRYTRKPRLLSAETVEIYTKNFSSEEIEKETENVFQVNDVLKIDF